MRTPQPERARKSARIQEKIERYVENLSDKLPNVFKNLRGEDG